MVARTGIFALKSGVMEPPPSGGDGMHRRDSPLVGAVSQLCGALFEGPRLHQRTTAGFQPSLVVALAVLYDRSRPISQVA